MLTGQNTLVDTLIWTTTVIWNSWISEWDYWFWITVPEQQCRAAASMGWASVLKIQPPDSTTHSPKGVLIISPENQWKQDFKSISFP